jgi:hypothetical protein
MPHAECRTLMPHGEMPRIMGIALAWFAYKIIPIYRTLRMAPAGGLGRHMDRSGTL